MGGSSNSGRLQVALLALRLGVFITMAVWTVDKFVRPEHTAAVFSHFYLIENLSSTASYIVGAIQGLIVLAFVLGIKKRFSYGIVLLLHAISTFSCFKQYLDPYAEGPNILFFAAWPMLAACLALYLLRDQDTLLTA